MSFLKQIKPEAPPTPVDPADLRNRQDSARQRRLASGGRNATFLSSTVADVGSQKPTATLTGLNG